MSNKFAPPFNSHVKIFIAVCYDLKPEHLERFWGLRAPRPNGYFATFSACSGRRNESTGRWSFRCSPGAPMTEATAFMIGSIEQLVTARSLLLPPSGRGPISFSVFFRKRLDHKSDDRRRILQTVQAVKTAELAAELPCSSELARALVEHPVTAQRHRHGLQ